MEDSGWKFEGKCAAIDGFEFSFKFNGIDVKHLMGEAIVLGNGPHKELGQCGSAPCMPGNYWKCI